jgi:hypothetical protein
VLAEDGIELALGHHELLVSSLAIQQAVTRPEMVMTLPSQPLRRVIHVSTSDGFFVHEWS